jgi:hypothetical protein
MIEYTKPIGGRSDPYCWICGGYGCESPHEFPGGFSWSPERVAPLSRSQDRPLSWLNGPPVRWWDADVEEVAA